MVKKRITTLFLDIGGVIMTNGWDRNFRQMAIHQFNLEPEEFNLRHKEFYDLYEAGHFSLDEYLKKVIFYKERSFTLESFKDFMFSFSKPYPDMIAYFKNLKEAHNLRVCAVSNEGKELAIYRIHYAHLKDLFDDFFISGFVGYQKPDPRIYQMALDVTQVPKENVIYIDDRESLIEAAAQLGIQGIQQVSLRETEQELNRLFKA
jgi:putative hydrolase of the HAD superfamily